MEFRGGHRYCTAGCCQARTERWSLSRALTHTSLSAHGAVRSRSGGGRNEFPNNFFENVSPVLLTLCRFTSFCLRRVICHHHHQHPCLDSMLGFFLLLLRQAPFDHKNSLQSLSAKDFFTRLVINYRLLHSLYSRDWTEIQIHTSYNVPLLYSYNIASLQSKVNLYDVWGQLVIQTLSKLKHFIYAPVL